MADDETPEEPYEDEEYTDNSSVAGTPPDADKQGTVEELFNTHKRVNELIKSWEGNGTQDAIAGRRFLKKQYSAMVGVINTTNAFTKKLGDECKAILYRSVKAFILDMVNDRTIKREHYYSLTFTYWHTIELFLGLPQNGHGALVLRDALAGLNTPEVEPKKESIVEWAKRNANN